MFGKQELSASDHDAVQPGGFAGPDRDLRTQPIQLIGGSGFRLRLDGVVPPFLIYLQPSEDLPPEIFSGPARPIAELPTARRIARAQSVSIRNEGSRTNPRRRAAGQLRGAEPICETAFASRKGPRLEQLDASPWVLAQARRRNKVSARDRSSIGQIAKRDFQLSGNDPTVRSLLTHPPAHGAGLVGVGAACVWTRFHIFTKSFWASAKAAAATESTALGAFCWMNSSRF